MVQHFERLFLAAATDSGVVAKIERDLVAKIRAKVRPSDFVTALHRVTGIPIPTVSRTVAKLQKDRWLSERQDPNDGRKRVIFLDARSLKQTRDEIDAKIQWFKNFRERGLPN